MATSTHVHLIINPHAVAKNADIVAAINKGAQRAKAAVSQKWLNDAAKNPAKAQISTDHLRAIKQADLVIAEVSGGNLDVGLLTYLAAQYRKQVLVLVEADSPATQQFQSGVQTKYLDVKEYHSLEEIASLVKSFITNEAIPDRDLRFNMFINHRIYRFLRQRSYETGMNRSEIIRQLLQKKIDDAQK